MVGVSYRTRLRRAVSNEPPVTTFDESCVAPFVMRLPAALRKISEFPTSWSANAAGPAPAASARIMSSVPGDV